MTKEDAYELLLRCFRDPTIRQQFLKNPLEVLKTTNLNLSEPELMEVAEIVPGLEPSDSSTQKLYEMLQADFANMAVSLRKSVLRVVAQIEDGFRNVMRMYLIAF